ncbi:hypothetical protein RND71_022033 [Anisodus tanguticus]|uniref:RNase H type-1 domain-containing protein n=1 Tax=Anisodus tanguticus TaxID=243964 RepID=A0AAE1RWB1_9SOLA|nr:hypothetical protein RND71_022033 [Anisodus tanguticus]
MGADPVEVHSHAGCIRGDLNSRKGSQVGVAVRLLRQSGVYLCALERVAAAGAFRDHKGDWILGFQQKCYANSPLHAELLALEKGLQLANKRNLYPIEIELDSTEAINAVFNGNELYYNLI